MSYQERVDTTREAYSRHAAEAFREAMTDTPVVIIQVPRQPAWLEPRPPRPAWGHWTAWGRSPVSHPHCIGWPGTANVRIQRREGTDVGS